MLKTALSQTHAFLKEIVVPGDTVIDATVGNGNDTILLAQLVGKTGKVIGFDIQSQGLEETKTKLLLTGLTTQVSLYHQGHETVDQLDLSPESVTAAVFNLGYLPKGNREIITHPSTTVEAIEKILPLLARKGFILIMVYYGHSGGTDEKDAVISFVKTLPQKEYTVLSYKFINQVNSPPFLLAIEKK
ncbi:tRNA (mnm(5)s(2)U34)-methyltransferase [Lacticigenium naphthae]|uniref:tRNA (mnm(5)s(2)U34)-methyltransferase n=1 Tax=Lacticigenium naphthae TaxID=515351 RepID=UPI0004183DB7|nr:class I SAM-dependent methyltransferase [Lacticigenium naphthae]